MAMAMDMAATTAMAMARVKTMAEVVAAVCGLCLAMAEPALGFGGHG